MSNIDEEALKAAAKARRKVVMINPEEFLGLFTKGLKFAKNTTVFDGVPEDAKLLGIAYDVRLDSIVMVVSSSEYDEIEMTELPPRQFIGIKMGEVSKVVKKKK